ncbi:MAG: hypothetical protein AB7D39_19610 [Pseudodesulfovibrio sp.]|uniref:Uncharacterized protein n=3 Tax=Pseudodesulfovibrio indicus TaxID=1716143 RepID=A0AA94PP02_9BACT|nr:hypothetical protein EDC59_101396 [Pseudodesulfovibrio indicus]
MTETSHMNTTTMLGTYSLEDGVPVDPEIVLANCHDTAMLGQLVNMFAGSQDVRFFLLHEVDEHRVDFGADFHFVKDSGNWVLANHDHMIDVLFDDASFNPTGSEGTFSLVSLDDGSWTIDAHAVDAYDLPSPDQLLVDMPEHDLFVQNHVIDADSDSETIFIDPSVLHNGDSEILVANFSVGHDSLELPDGMIVRNVVVDDTHNVTELTIGQEDALTGNDDIVVKLLGVSQPDLPSTDFGLEPEHATDDLINHIINSHLSSE